MEQGKILTNQQSINGLKNNLITGKRRHFQQNFSIWEPENIADKLYFVESGSVRIVELLSNGSEILLERVGANEFFGESCIFGRKHEKRKTAARAFDDCIIVEVSAPEFFGSVTESDELIRAFINSASLRLERAAQRIAVLSSRQIDQRLGRILLLLAKTQGIKKPQNGVKIFVTHEELASLTAASRQRITKTMNEFRKIGLVKYDRIKPLEIDVSAIEEYLQN